MKRLTIDVPVHLHQRVKSQCALNGKNMSDVIRDLLEANFHNDTP
jgi:Arc/MetJ-type ribon-helix-helix transcriptional regulator